MLPFLPTAQFFSKRLMSLVRWRDIFFNFIFDSALQVRRGDGGEKSISNMF